MKDHEISEHSTRRAPGLEKALLKGALKNRWHAEHRETPGTLTFIVVVVVTVVVVVIVAGPFSSDFDYDNDNRFADNDIEKKVRL